MKNKYILISIIVLGIFLLGSNAFFHVVSQLKNGFFAKSVEILISCDNDTLFDIVKITPTGNEGVIPLFYFEDKKIYSGLIEERHVKKIRLQIKKSDLSSIKDLKIKIDDKEFYFDNEKLSSEWIIEEKGGSLYLTNPDAVYYFKSFLSKYSSKFNTINWPSDKEVIGFMLKSSVGKLFAFLIFIFTIVIVLFKGISRNAVSQNETPKNLLLLEKAFLKTAFLETYLKKYATVLLLLSFLLISVFVRHMSFSKTIHVDEPTYLVMADRLVKGDLLYKDVVDNKAPMLFLYYVIPMFLFNNLVMIRLFGALLVGLTGFVIYLVLKKIINDYINLKNKENLKYIPFIGGVSYILISSFHLWNFWINPEQLVILFDSLALLFLLSKKRFSVFLCSLTLGFTFMTKYPAGIDYAAFALIWFIIKIKDEKKIVYYVKNILLSIAAFLLPTLVTIIFFAIQGNLKDFIDVFYMVTFKYPSKKTLGIILKTLFLFPKDLFVIFTFFILGFVYLSTKKELRFLFMIILIWGGSTLFCILSPGKDFTYYWFQFWGVASLVIPFSILALNNFFSKITNDKNSSLIFNLLIVIFVFDLSLGNNFQNFSPKEYVYEARDILKNQVKKDTLMLTDEEGTHILYWMLNLNPPAKYIHTMGDFSNYYKNESEVFEPQILVNPSYKWYDKLGIRENYNLLFAKGKYKIYTRKIPFSK